MSINWRIYYSDKSTFDSTQGEPCDAPGYGVICIVQPDDDTGRLIMHKWDFYYYVPSTGQWWGSDLQGLLDRLSARLPVVAMCQGRSVTTRLYGEILGMADKDIDFAPKNGLVPIERGGNSYKGVGR